MAELSVMEAISLAQRCKNQFKAFERLEEVLGLAAQAEQTVTEKAREKAILEKKITVLKSDLESLEKDVPGYTAASTEAEKEYRGKIANLQKGLDKASAEASQKHREYTASLVAIEHKTGMEHKERMAAMEKAEKNIQKRKDALQVGLDALVNQAKKAAG